MDFYDLWEETKRGVGEITLDGKDEKVCTIHVQVPSPFSVGDKIEIVEYPGPFKRLWRWIRKKIFKKDPPNVYTVTGITRFRIGEDGNDQNTT
jgi:hypothetical protein